MDGQKIKEKKKREREREIPPTPSRLCCCSLCNDLPKEPDFLATACHQTFGRSSTFSFSLSLSLSHSVFVRNGSAVSLSLSLLSRAASATASMPASGSPIILFSIQSGTLRAKNHQSPLEGPRACLSESTCESPTPPPPTSVIKFTD